MGGVCSSHAGKAEDSFVAATARCVDAESVQPGCLLPAEAEILPSEASQPPAIRALSDRYLVRRLHSSGYAGDQPKSTS
ncbi:MAG: hypothetical protein RLZZ536_720 [Planctomycetota bacterium]